MIESKIRPIREALCLALFLGPLFLGPLFSAAAQSPRPADVRRQMELGLYREAETAVNEALAQAAQEPAGKEPPLFLRREWRLLLAEIYYHSRQYDRAVEQVQMAGGLLEVENRIRVARRLHPCRTASPGRPSGKLGSSWPAPSGRGACEGTG